jgi:hypothetical protein
MASMHSDEIDEATLDSPQLSNRVSSIVNNLMGMIRGEIKLAMLEGRSYTKQLVDIASMRFSEAIASLCGFLFLSVAAVLALRKLLYDSYELSFLIVGALLICIKPLSGFYLNKNERRNSEAG